MLNQTRVKTLDKVVVRFSGDSGDGMQLAGNIFTNVSAGLGNLVSTFPDYPAEVRAPQGSLSGVSGYQVSVGKGVVFGLLLPELAGTIRRVFGGLLPQRRD